MVRYAARLKANELIELSKIYSLPYTSKQEGNKILRDLKRMASEDIPHDVQKDREKLRRVLKGSRI